MPAKSLFTVEDMEVLNGDEMQSSRVRRAHYYKTFDSIAVKSISNITVYRYRAWCARHTLLG